MLTLIQQIGHEQAKIRPCVVVSNNQMNSKLGLSIVVPLTGKAWFTNTGRLSQDMVEIPLSEGGLSNKGYSIAFQVRTVSHLRFVRRRGILTEDRLQAIVQSVQKIIAY